MLKMFPRQRLPEDERLGRNRQAEGRVSGFESRVVVILRETRRDHALPEKKWQQHCYLGWPLIRARGALRFRGHLLN